jgi:hypothetical protein
VVLNQTPENTRRMFINSRREKDFHSSKGCSIRIDVKGDRAERAAYSSDGVVGDHDFD